MKIQIQNVPIIVVVLEIVLKVGVIVSTLSKAKIVHSIYVEKTVMEMEFAYKMEDVFVMMVLKVSFVKFLSILNENI